MYSGGNVSNEDIEHDNRSFVMASSNRNGKRERNCQYSVEDDITLLRAAFATEAHTAPYGCTRIAIRHMHKLIVKERRRQGGNFRRPTEASVRSRLYLLIREKKENGRKFSPIHKSAIHRERELLLEKLLTERASKQRARGYSADGVRKKYGKGNMSVSCAFRNGNLRKDYPTPPWHSSVAPIRHDTSMACMQQPVSFEQRYANRGWREMLSREEGEDELSSSSEEGERFLSSEEDRDRDIKEPEQQDPPPYLWYRGRDHQPNQPLLNSYRHCLSNFRQRQSSWMRHEPSRRRTAFFSESEREYEHRNNDMGYGTPDSAGNDQSGGSSLHQMGSKNVEARDERDNLWKELKKKHIEDEAELTRRFEAAQAERNRRFLQEKQERRKRFMHKRRSKSLREQALRLLKMEDEMRRSKQSDLYNPSRNYEAGVRYAFPSLGSSDENC